jgi:hypothetical protein
MTKTKDYVLRAHNNYIHKRDRIVAITPSGTIDRIRKCIGETGSISAYVNQLISADLDAREKGAIPAEEKPVEIKPESESDLPWNNL